MSVRDGRKNSAYASGMRGREKAAIAEGNVQGESGSSQPAGASGGESTQGPHTKVGDPQGVGLDAYQSGMRGSEKAKQKPASSATQAPNNEGGAGNPNGDANAARVAPSMEAAALQQHTTDAHAMGTPGSNTETAVSQDAPTFEDDDTHVHIKVPKAAFKRRAPSGAPGGI